MGGPLENQHLFCRATFAIVKLIKMKWSSWFVQNLYQIFKKGASPHLREFGPKNLSQLLESWICPSLRTWNKTDFLIPEMFFWTICLPRISYTSRNQNTSKTQTSVCMLEKGVKVKISQLNWVCERQASSAINFRH